MLGTLATLAIGVRSVSTLIGSFWPGITGDTHMAAIAARPIVRPSGAAFATVSLAMKPEAPDLLSTITFWPTSGFSASARMRHKRSALPPGGKPHRKRTSPEILPCDLAGEPAAAPSAAMVAPINRLRLILYPPCFGKPSIATDVHALPPFRPHWIVRPAVRHRARPGRRFPRQAVAFRRRLPARRSQRSPDAPDRARYR